MTDTPTPPPTTVTEAADLPPVGTLVRDEHLNDKYWPGASVWCRIARWTPGHGSRAAWLCLHSDAPGNVLHEYDEDDRWSPQFAAMPVVGAIPGSPADLARTTPPVTRAALIAAARAEGVDQLAAMLTADRLGLTDDDPQETR